MISLTIETVNVVFIVVLAMKPGYHFRMAYMKSLKIHYLSCLLPCVLF